jgi:hypothetical protein
VARTLLNIHVRDCVYSAHVRSPYSLGQIEPFCEVPLDSITAEKLRDSRSRWLRVPSAFLGNTRKDVDVYHVCGSSLRSAYHTRQIG